MKDMLSSLFSKKENGIEKLTIEKFNDLEWHDAIIENIVIDRSNPGKKDQIEFFITWYDKTKSTICFNDVYWADLNMNFGVVALESIYSAFAENRECEQVKEYNQKTKGFFNNIDLNYYEIETNSTGSVMKIIAKEVIVINR